MSIISKEASIALNFSSLSLLLLFSFLSIAFDKGLLKKITNNGKIIAHTINIGLKTFILRTIINIMAIKELPYTVSPANPLLENNAFPILRFFKLRKIFIIIDTIIIATPNTRENISIFIELVDSKILNGNIEPSPIACQKFEKSPSNPKQDP